MNARVDTLLQQAKTLAPPEQAELLDALFELVSPSTPEWENAWRDECERRMHAIDRGEMSLIAADVVMAKYVR